MRVSAETVHKIANSIPFYKHLGMQVTSVGRGRATIRMKLKKDLLLTRDVIHGGALCSVIDSAVGIALYSLVWPQPIATVELKVNFIAPATGDLTVRGRIISKRSTIAVGEAAAYDSKGKLVAMGIATYMILKPRS